MTAIHFEEIRPLFGLHIEAPEVLALLEEYPDHRITKPSDGDQYVLFRSLGFDLLFRPRAGLSGSRTKNSRVLTCIFLYREGKDRHREFVHPPFGIAFSDHRDVLLTKLGKPFAASDYDECGLPGWEKWNCDGCTVHTMYDRATMTTQVFSIGRADLSL